MSVEFDTPANRIIAQQAPKNQFNIQLLPDIAFLRQLSVQGRMVFNQSIETGAEVGAVITPANGTTFFLLGATASPAGNNANSFQLRNDGNIRQAITVGAQTTQRFHILADALVGDGTKTYDVNRTSAAAGNSQTSIWGWFENTARIRDVTT